MKNVGCRLAWFAILVLALGVLRSGTLAAQTLVDLDGDGIPNASDNCPFTSNPLQTDTDADGLGDACDSVNDVDFDGDGILNSGDNCPFTSNPLQTDTDADGQGDACDPFNDRDLDADAVLNANDNCPFASNPLQADSDADGQGDACDPFDDRDLDADGVLNANDNCPFAINPLQEDADGDGVGDACDGATTSVSPIEHAAEWVAGVAPNPLVTHCRIRFTLPQDSPAALTVFDLSGRRVRALANGFLRAGSHEIEWDGTTDDGAHAPSGAYFVRLFAPGGGFEQRVVKIR
jgi:hypothetical protein